MSQADANTAANSKKEPVEETEINDEKKKARDDQHKSEEKEPRRSKIRNAWKGIFVVTQFWVITLAVVAFLVVITSTMTKLSDRQTLESKDTVEVANTWFKFAICLRPFMTADLMKEMYTTRLNRSFDAHLASLVNLSNEGKAQFMRPFYFDNMLEPQVYHDYFAGVHPWRDISPHVLWEYQNITIRRAFEEFQVNLVRMKSNSNRTTHDMDSTDSPFTTLTATKPPKKRGPALLGQYSLSPLYLGCLSVTVNREMSRRQMEISVKFRNKRRPKVLQATVAETDTNAKGQDQITLFEAADIFVYHKNETFTEIPIIKDLAKFSVMADSRERLLVKSSDYARQKTSKRDCEANETYSETKCRQGCIIGLLLEEIECTLPWMEHLINEPKLEAKYNRLPMCSNMNGSSLLETVRLEGEYLNSDKASAKKSVQLCLGDCPEPCRSYQVRILSLGSKSIGRNYGVSLTISPAVDVVREHFNYNMTNMLSELCASVSFLLGLSAIAIYDWLVAFGVWASIKLGLYTAEEDDATPASPPPPSPPPRKHHHRRKTHAHTGASPEEAPGPRASNDSAVGDVEPAVAADGAEGQEGSRPRRNSLQLPKERLPGGHGAPPDLTV